MRHENSLFRGRACAVYTAVSLLACLGLSAAIGRSYRVLDQWNRFQGTAFWSVELEQGQLFVVRGRSNIDQGHYAIHTKRPAGRSLPPPWSAYDGGTSQMQLFANGQSGALTLSHHRFSLWYLAALTAVLPVAGAIRHVRARRRVEVGHCAACGYDLRATPDRCPECGQAGVAG